MARLETGGGTHGEHRGAHHAARYGNVEGGEARRVKDHEPLPGPARELALGARRDRGEVGVLVGEDVAGGGKARRHARVSRPHDGHHLVADVGAQVARVLVGRVLAPDDPAHAQEVAELLVSAVEQGANDAVATARDRGEPRRAGAANGVHEEGLRAVVRRVRGEDPRRGARRPQLVRELGGQPRRLGVAQLAPRVLDVVARSRRNLSDVHAPDGAGDPVATGEVAHELLVLLRVDAAQLVVHVQDVQTLARDARLTTAVLDVERRGCREHEQRRRVGAARDHEDHRRRERSVRAPARPLEAPARWPVPTRDARHAHLQRLPCTWRRAALGKCTTARGAP